MNRRPPHQHLRVGGTAMPDDEDILVSKARINDRDAWERLWAKYRRLLFSIALGILYSRADAEEVLQETFLNAFRFLPTFKGGSFKSWLRTIVRNAALRRLRRKERLAEVPLEELRPNSRRFEQGKSLEDLPAEEFIPDPYHPEISLDRLAVSEFLPKLKPRHRKIIELLIEYRCTVGDLAEHLHMTKDTVRASITAFRKAYREDVPPAKAKKQSA